MELLKLLFTLSDLKAVIFYQLSLMSICNAKFGYLFIFYLELTGLLAYQVCKFYLLLLKKFNLFLIFPCLSLELLNSTSKSLKICLLLLYRVLTSTIFLFVNLTYMNFLTSLAKRLLELDSRLLAFIKCCFELRDQLL